MNLEEVQFSRLLKGCIVKIKYPVEVQIQADIMSINRSNRPVKGWAENISLSPGEYYKVFATRIVGGEPIIWLDLVKDTGYMQPWVSTRFLTLDDECNKYNEEILSTRKNVNLSTLKTFLELGGIAVNGN